MKEKPLMYCDSCGKRETPYERNQDKDCPCGGNFLIRLPKDLKFSAAKEADNLSTALQLRFADDDDIYVGTMDRSTVEQNLLRAYIWGCAATLRSLK